MAIPLAHDSAPYPPYASVSRDVARRKIAVVAIIAVVFVLACVIVSGVFAARYFAKYSVMDKSRQSLAWDTDPSRNVSTTYQNPTYGLTLTLPGKWTLQTEQTMYLCRLASDRGFRAVLAIDFPIFTPAIDTDAALVKSRYETRDQWTFQSEESIQVSGLPAHVLRMTTPHDFAVDSLLVKRWPLVYEFAVVGPANDTDDWQRIRAAFPQVLQVN